MDMVENLLFELEAKKIVKERKGCEAASPPSQSDWDVYKRSGGIKNMQ